MNWIEWAVDQIIRSFAALVRLVIGIPGTLLWAIGNVLVIAAEMTPVVLDRLVEFFHLKMYGDTLFVNRVKFDFRMYAALLACIGIFEFFAWSSLFGYTGVETLWVPVLTALFMIAVVQIDRGLLLMDTTGSLGRAVAVTVTRLMMLLALATVTSIAMEMRVFSPEIDRVIAEAETARVDLIRERAKSYEEGLAEKRITASDELFKDGSTDVVERRARERSALADSKRADRAEITTRLEANRLKTETEITVGSGGGRPGQGPKTTGLRNEAKSIREELAAFDDRSREEMSAFDQETERMRGAAVAEVTTGRTQLTTALDEKLHAIEVMEPAELAKTYGGEYLEPKGFMARYRTLLSIADAPDTWTFLGFTRNGIILWVCRAIMVTFGISAIFVKFLITGRETVAYLSPRMQAIALNREALLTFRTAAREKSDPDAIEILKMVAPNDAESAIILTQLGITAAADAERPTAEVVALRASLAAARAELAQSLGVFRQAFHGLCRERTSQAGRSVGIIRHELNDRAETTWRTTVEPKLQNLSAIETVLRHQGVMVSPWPAEFEEVDPRTGTRQRLWKMDDSQLEREFGWVARGS